MRHQLRSLEPKQIGGLFGRRSSLAEELPIRHVQPKVRFVVIATAAVLLLLFLAGQQRALITENATSAISIFLSGAPQRGPIALPLLEDPVGLMVILTALATPISCAEQVAAIDDFVPNNLRNIEASSRTLDEAAINKLVDRTNRQFALLGTWWSALLLAAGSFTVGVEVYMLFPANGLMQSWLPESSDKTPTGKLVYSGWWANSGTHLLLAIALCVVATYLFYFLTKQVIMGVIFAVFVRSVGKLGFGVTPNLKLNSDGYWGLRNLRRFMQWTYGSTLTHFVATLGVFVLWLPFGQWTILLIVGVMIVNSSVVVYPSFVAHNFIVREKKRFVENELPPGASQEDHEKMVDKIWSSPHLPFRTSSTLTAAFVYLLAPLLLLVVSSLVKH